MKSIRAVVAATITCGFLVAVPAAQAHNVTSATLGCSNGGTLLTVNVTSFTPVNGQRETIAATYTNGATGSYVSPADQGTFYETGPSVPNGTVLGVTLKWPEGTYTVKPVVLSCQPTPPPPPTCTPPQTLQNGQCVTPPTPPPPAPPTTPTPPAAPPAPPTPPHHHPHAARIVLHVAYLNQDPPLVALTARANPFGCRIVGPPSTQQHGLAHWVVRCRSARVLPGGKWFVDGRLVQNRHWSYVTDGGRRFNSWLFDAAVWTNPLVWGHYEITYKGRVRRR